MDNQKQVDIFSNPENKMTKTVDKVLSANTETPEELTEEDINSFNGIIDPETKSFNPDMTMEELSTLIEHMKEKGVTQEDILKASARADNRVRSKNDIKITLGNADYSTSEKSEATRQLQALPPIIKYSEYVWWYLVPLNPKVATSILPGPRAWVYHEKKETHLCRPVYMNIPKYLYAKVMANLPSMNFKQQIKEVLENGSLI